MMKCSIPIPNPTQSTPITTNLISFYFDLIHSSPNPSHLRHLHARLLRTGLYSNVILSSKLLLSYSNPHRLIRSSLSLFLHMPTRNSFSWNTIISLLSRFAYPRKSLHFFLTMRSRGVRIDEFTLPSVLRSSVSIRSLADGMMIHGLGIKMGLAGNLFVASALVCFYVGLSKISYARKVFDEMPIRDSVLWTSMLSGYAQSGEPERALGVFREMMNGGVEIDEVVVVSLLLVCGQLGSVGQGRIVHGLSVRRSMGLPLSLGNALIDMYVKCGVFNSAERVFSVMPTRDVISWSTLILGHGLNGHADVALKLFDEMRSSGIEPNAVTFLGLLSSCVHSGMVDRAQDFLNVMKQCKVEPELKHYSCIVDALAKSGRVEEAEKFVEEMPVEPDESVLGALLSGCRVHGKVEVGERVAQNMMGMRPDKSGYYTILANLYSDAGRFNEADEVRCLMTKMNISKLPGCSLIELDDRSSSPCHWIE